jgi:hypothetical protein
LAWSTLLLFLLVGILFARIASLRVDYIPINGSFQTFNPIQRILDGEVPGRDFNPYLGLGVTYLTTIATFLLGGDFGASQFSVHLICTLCHFTFWGVTLKLSGCSWKWSITVASAATLLILTYLLLPRSYPNINIFDIVDHPIIDSYPIYNWYELTAPGNSLLAVRGVLPFVTSAILLFIFQSTKSRPRILYAAAALLAGIQPYWSNDFGLPSCTALIGISILYIAKTESTLKCKGLYIFRFLLISLISFFLVGNILTFGHFGNWMTANFGGVASDQFWYFWFMPFKAFAPFQLFPHPILTIYFTLTILTFVVFIFRKVEFEQVLFVYLNLTVIGAGILGCLAGSIDYRYYSLAIFVSYFAAAKLVISLIHLGQAKVSEYFGIISEKDALKPLKGFFKSLASILLISIYVISIYTAVRYASYVPIGKSEQSFYNDDLGGWLSQQYQPAVDIGNRIKQKTVGLPAEQKMLSTYASGMDRVAGSRNATDIDYIIHALGEAARSHYISKYLQHQPEFITTIRQDYTDWENWVRRTNWWFYREFIRQYDIVDATFYNLVWQRRETPKPLPEIAASCQISQESSNVVNLIVSTAAIPGHSTRYFIDITLNYQLDIQETIYPLIGKRGIISGIDTNAGVSKSIGISGNQSYGLPPGHSNWHVPLENELGTTSTLRLVGYPVDRATLRVNSCATSVIASASALELQLERTPLNFTDVNWVNGISIIPTSHDFPHTGFIINNPEQLLAVQPTEVIFEKSGRRQILDIKGNQVWVSGPSLDPVEDGYPHRVKFISK